MARVALDLDGSAADAALTACLSNVEVRQALNAPSLALITFLDPPAAASGLAMGTTVTLRMPDGPPLFDGEITAVNRTVSGNKERSLTIRAYDKLHRLRKQQRLRHLNDIGLSDFASLVAGDLGLDVDGGGDSETRPVVIQHRQSDFDLLSELASDAGLHFWLEGSSLKLMSLGGDGGDEVRLAVGENILEAVSDVSAEPMRKASHALGWELATNQVQTGEVGMSAQDALEMRMDAMSAFEGLGDRFLVNRLCDSPDGALRLAQADIDRATARGLKLDALCEGDPGLRPGRVIRLEGMGSETDGAFVVSSAVHRFDAGSGYTTRVATDAPPLNGRPPASMAATLGVIVDTDDPEGKSRVKARFPVLGDVTGSWMPVLSVGAGKSKGFAVIPETDDEVLVLLPDGNPARGIVLGGLYGANTAPGERTDEGARSFVVRSPSGPQVTLDGVRALVRLESGDGEIIEMGPDGTLFRAMRDMTIEAPGHALKIRAARVDFERA